MGNLSPPKKAASWPLFLPCAVAHYVVVHERCHLVHHNHAPAYRWLIEAIMPDFRQAKVWRRVNGQMLRL